jgi:hypothetical protein
MDPTTQKKIMPIRRVSRRVYRSLPVIAAPLLALALPAAATQSFTYGVDAGVAETDNVTLVPTDKISQTEAITDLDFDFKQQTRLIDADAKGNFSYLDYLQNAYNNQLLGRFDGNAKIAVIPDRLTWVVQDDFGQSALDPFTPTTPNNLENVNYLSTGPDLSLRLGGTGFFNMSARYARTSYETSPFNSNRLQGSLGVGLLLSARSTVSLNADTERVLFTDTTLNTDFNRTNAFLRYTLQGARTDLSADVGATRVSQTGDSTSGVLAKLQASRKLSSAATLKLSLGRDLTDASASFSSLQSGAIGVVGTAPAAVTSNSYTSDYASLDWQYHRFRTDFGVSGRWEKDVYGTDPALDVTRGGAEFRVGRRLTRSLRGELLGRLYRTDYINANAAAVAGSPTYDDQLIAGILTWRHGRGLEIKLRCEHDARVTSASDFGYKDNRAVLTIGYRPFTRAPVEEEESPAIGTPGA